MQLVTGTGIGVAVPGVLLAGALAALFASGGVPTWTVAAGVVPPAVVTVMPHAAFYRVAGAYLLKGTPVDAPRLATLKREPLSIMALEVRQQDYAQCVDDGYCKAAADPAANSGSWPVTGVSFVDANRYAAWLSQATGQFWRLPTDEEWAFAAGSRFADDGLGLAANALDPAERWSATYAFEYRLGQDAVTVVQPSGHFGGNEYGVIDLSGNIWEWTSSCYDRVLINADGTTASTTQNCGVRVLEGRHRTYQTNFIRDAKGGGCAVGKPPDHLGFRLVRETSTVPFFDRLRAWWFYR